MAVQINVAANQAALTASIQAGVQAYNQRFAQNNPINLSINQRAFSQPLGRMTGDVKDFEAALAASNARVIAFGASTAVLGGVIRSFKELANVTIDVEKNLADINRVFGLTTSQLQKFSTDLFSVGKQTASSFDDASKAALEFSRQGLKAEEVLIRTKDALTLARVAGISTANSVDALTSTVNGFAATGVTTSQILNKLVAVEQDFAVGAGDLAEALSRTGQAAQEAGVSLDQLNALVTAAQQSTARGGAVIGNALKTIFTRLQRTETLDQLEAFNIAVRDVQGNTLPAVTVLQNFAGAYKNLGDAQRAQLSEQVAGVYQVNILKAIVGDLNKSQGVYAGALQRGASATNEAEVATAKLNQTLDALLKQTATSTQQLANNIGKVTFEPLARYGTEQLKSLVESMNEILEGEGVGSTFANGLLKGIRNVIAGPGAIAAFFTLFKLIQNSFTYLAQALPQIAGITTETQNRKNIEQSILQIMQQQGPVSQALAGAMGNQAAQAQLLLQLARQQTAEYQIQSTLAKQLATQLAGQGVRVKGSGGLQVTRAGGYIPAATRIAEAVGAQAGGYAPGKVVKSPVGGVMNTAEDVKYVPGFAQPFINPPAGSKAGRAHRQNAISRTGVDPYTAGGFIPNFAKKSIRSLGQQSLNNFYDVGDRVGNTTFYDKYDDQGLIKTFNLPFTYEEYRSKAAAAYDNASKIYKTEGVDGGLANANKYLKEATGGYSQALEKKYFDEPDTSPAKKHLNKIAGGFGEKDTAEIFNKHTKLINAVGPDFKKIIKNRVSFIETKVRKNDVSDEVLLEKFLRGYAKTSLPVSFKGNGDEDVISAKFGTLIHAIAAKTPDTKSLGFIPNFAPPTSAIRVPWFKKFGNASFDAVQPTLGISKANDTDTFRSSQFRSKAFEKAATDGDPNLFAPLYEDFVFKALQLTSQSKIKDQLIRGYVNQPGTDQKQSAFDAFLGDVAFEKKGFPKGNLTGSISKNLNDKFERYVKANPAGAAKIKESVMVFNELAHENQITSDFGKNFTQLAGTSYSQMLKNSPDLVKGLSAETNSLLNNYVKNPAFLAMNAAKGFLPNFASMISSSIKGKGNISAIKTGKNDYEIEGVEVGKKFRGQGLGSQLYGNIAQKIGSGSTIKSVLLPQEQALADYASGKSIPAKAIFPQLSWAKMAKSSKLLINGKEIAMSDFESGIAGHKYNAAKLDMALIELVNSHASGFIPNFAYQQAVMSLEEGMSGEKAIFDTKPFPHIRNKSQPTFSSAIADHGGLGNALSDSMRGQKAAGLMSKGFVPNFSNDRSAKRTIAKNQAKNKPQNTKSSSNAIEVVENYAESYTQEALRDIKKTYRSTIDKIKSMFSEVDSSVSSVGIDAVKSLREQTFKKGRNTPEKNITPSKFSEQLSKASTAIAIAGPMLAGFAEQAMYGNRKRTDMTSEERMGQSALSTGLSSFSTGAGIGASFGLPGAIIGGAIGGLVGLTSALNAATLSAEELGQLNQEQTQKSQASISAASSYIEAQKSLTEMISSGASSSDIEIATKKLSLGFNEIADVKLQEIFNATGGDVKKMTEELQKYTNETTKKSAVKKGLIEKIGVEDRVSALSTGLNKEQKKSYIEALKDKNLRELKLQKQNITIGQQLFADNYVTAVQTSNQSASKDVAARMLKNVGITSENDPNYESNLKAAMTQIMDMSISQMDALIAGLEKNDIVSQAGKAAVNFKQAATRSFNQIFLDMEQIIAKSAFDVALNFEKDSGSRRIQSAILDFSMNFQDSINSFLSNNLPDARKFDFTAATAGQKAEMLLQKSQQDYNKAIAEQDNERSVFLTKSSENLMEKFKSSFLPSQASAEFFQSNTLPQIQAGTFTGDAKSLAEQFKSASFTKAQNKVGAVGMNLTDVKGASETLKEINFQMEILANGNDTESETYKNLLSARQALIDLQNQTALFENENQMTKMQNAITTSVREQQTFEQKQENAKKELEINKQLSEARIAADKEIAVAKARVDKDNLMRMEKMKDLSANIGNALEISKARSSASVNAMQRRLDDQRETYGMGRSQISERKFGIQADILKEQRIAEDAAINAEIQQRVLEMAAEQENTAATLELNKTIMALIETQLSEALGGSNNIQEMQNNPYIGMSGQQIDDYLEKRQQDLGAEYNPSNEESRIIEAKSYSPQNISQYQAFQRIQESRAASAANNTGYNTSTFESNMQSRGFNDRMNQAEQLTFLEEEETAARNAGNIVLAGTIKRYQEQIKTKQQALQITRDDIDAQVRLNTQIEKVNNTFAGRFKKGWGNLKQEGDDLLLNLGENLPKMFADGLVDGIKAAIRESNNLGEALMGIASKFLDSISTTLMQSAVYGILGNIGVPNLPVGGKQRGGVIRAQSGMYISGVGSGDKYPAMLENGEYVLNRNAVMAMGGPASLDKLNFSAAPRFAAGGSFSNKFEDISSMESNMTSYGLEESKLYNELRDQKRAEIEAARQKKRAQKQQMAGLIGSLAGAAVSLGISAGVNKFGNKPSTPQQIGDEYGQLALRTDFSGSPFKKQVGGSIGSRLSDTVPAYTTGGLIDSPVVKRYATGGVSSAGFGTAAGNNSTVNNNSNASNSFNFNTTVQRDGKIQMGANSTSYAQQDVELSQNLNSKVYDVVLETIRKEKRFGGSLAGIRN